MTTKKILVTGGAGFIGSHLVDKLIEQGHEVRILDNLNKQAHPNGKPEYLNPKAEFLQGDVRARYPVSKALEDIEVVFHEVARIGVGQSMQKPHMYVDNNCNGTAVLMDMIVNGKFPVEQVIVAGSINGYGEGLYTCSDCGDFHPNARTEEQLKNKDWNIICPECKLPACPVPAPETTLLDCTSVYGLTKKMQEDLVLLLGKANGIKATCLRYANVYGPRQALNNPYSGAAALFINKVLNNEQPLIFEDGLQQRDFVSVQDVVEANILAMESPAADQEVFNVGTGEQSTVLEMARQIISSLEKDFEPLVPGEYRVGDVRHSAIDISKIKSKLGFKPKVKFKDGLEHLIRGIANDANNG